MYTNTPDRHFVIDLHPDDSRIVVISACSGHGFKFAPVIGEIAADLVRDGRTHRDISRFAAARFAKAAS
jgi:sarcosine oxidase